MKSAQSLSPNPPTLVGGFEVKKSTKISTNPRKAGKRCPTLVCDTHLIDSCEVLKEDLDRDPAFGRYWERTAPARAVASTLIAYRVERNLSQAELAERLGISLLRVERLEAGEHNPTWNTLILLVKRVGLSFFYGVEPPDLPHSNALPVWDASNVSTHTGGATVEKDSSPELVVVATSKVIDENR